MLLHRVFGSTLAGGSRMAAAPMMIKRALSTTVEAAATASNGESEEETRRRFLEEKEMYDALAKAEADAKLKQVETFRRELVEGPTRPQKQRVPDYIKPWQKVWFPNERIILVRPQELDVTCTELVFRVPPHMTKHEIKDYLQAIYGFDVKKVNTVNRLGKMKFPAGFSMVKGKAYRRPDFKQAYVFLNSPDLLQQPSNQITKTAPAVPAEDNAKTMP